MAMAETIIPIATVNSNNIMKFLETRDEANLGLTGGSPVHFYIDHVHVSDSDAMC